MAKNVFGEELMICSTEPLTGYYRNGCCETGEDDLGTHTVCAVMTDEFLRFSYNRGNDLITPRPEYSFQGLKAGDKWCLCASRWIEAYKAGCAPKVILEASNEKTLQYISLEELVGFAYV
ncbi:DUF2237 family protein [Belliella pelovolcani]|uniref:DUF2237 domain-containing protein n=1 Tax=Belliella pelovolcani TaxID=529505 RepID=A0A1N7M6F3_9BACT|nr:DUF2237 domain-containing protein [Belliella pelovolcani]SIS81650.1 hypothetical protein SAMN05421761_105137 [Belliella pelovolcani]